MTIRWLLNVNVAAMAFLGTLLLGLGQGSMAMPLAVLIAAVLSLWLTDAAGRFHLKRNAANLAAFAAVAFSVLRLAQSERASEFLVVVDLLIFVEIILLFQKKDLRTWWDLAMLSVLQVVVAATLSQGMLFGLLLILYLLLSLSALGLLHLYRVGVESARASARPILGDATAGGRDAPRVDWRRLGKVALAAAFVGPVALFLRYREPRGRRSPRSAPPSPPGEHRWPLARQKPTLTSPPPAAVEGDAVGWEFWGRLVKMSAWSLVLAPVVFVVLPRFGQLNVSFPRLRQVALKDQNAGRIVGFSDSVTLGELGELVENPEEVLRVQFHDQATGDNYAVSGDVYLRGAVLTRYDKGRWRHEAVASALTVREVRLDDLAPNHRLVRQTIEIEPMNRNEIFCVWPVVLTNQTRGLSFDARRQRLRRHDVHRNKRFRYRLATTAFVDGVQADLSPAENPIHRQAHLRIPSDEFPRLVALAERWSRQSAISADRHLSCARLLERGLRDSGQFQYSMEDQGRPLAIDPIEDFITNNPRGNCEFFATALVLMLRSRGIPARMVLGYKTDEYEYLDRYYQARQLHFHAWVEAYLAPEQLPSDLPESPLRDWSAGGWVRLDPTPLDSGGLAVMSRLVEGMGDWFEWLNSLWSTYVMGMDRSRQQEAIYRPLVDSVMKTGRQLTSRRWWGSALSDLGNTFDFRSWGLDQGRRLAWAGALLAATTALVVAFRRGTLRLPLPIHWLTSGGGKASSSVESRPPVRFYERLEKLLARYGLNRDNCETQREFTRKAGERLAQSAGNAALASLPEEVAETFYRVRFGGHTLDGSETAAVERALTQLERTAPGREAEKKPTGTIRPPHRAAGQEEHRHAPRCTRGSGAPGHR
ncbi:MAG: transglutaminase TgpA family protein [Planctomycetota bacterium]